MPQDNAGNSLIAAREIQLLNGSQIRSFSDRVDPSDLNDYYKFRLQGRSSFGLKLTNNSGNADLELLNSNGSRLNASTNDGSTSDLINTTLEAGTYYVRVYQGSGAGADYSLDFSSQTKLQSDILWRNSISGQNVIWQMNGIAIASGPLITSVPDQNWQIVASGDFNQDSQSDIVWRHSVSGQNVIWYMNGTSIQSGVEITPVTDTNWKIGTAGDFNNDGKVDLVWRNSLSGANVIWFMNGGTIASGIEITPVADRNWQLITSGDFNNDGKADLVWCNAVSGSNVIWLMNGSNIQSGVEITPVRDLNWSLVGNGDFDNDGQSDLVWRNGLSGSNVIWYMNGTSIRSGIEITAVNDRNWTIADVAQRFETPAPIDLVGNTLASALSIGTLSGNSSFTESIGGSDPSDYYRFSVSNPSVIDFTLSTPNLLFDILDSAGNVVWVQNQTFINPKFHAVLDAGTYYVRINSKNSLANYTLSIEARDNVVQRYDFSYLYNGGSSTSPESQDYYTGHFYDYAEKYRTDQFIDINTNPNETGVNGRYLIGKSIAAGTKSDLGKVYINRYYDYETATSFTPNGFLLNQASGTNFLGSEVDYINASSGLHNDFGRDAWEYDAKPDLIAASFDILQSNARPGNSISVQFSVMNKGQALAAASNVSFYLSTDSTITTTDRLLGTTSIPLFNGYLTSNLFNTTLTLPGFGEGIWYGNGNYFIGMIVDSGNTIAETNESNNINQGLARDLDRLAISMPSIVKIVASDPSAAEQGLDSGFFTISRTGDLSQQLVVNLGIGGTAIAGGDYTSGGSSIGALTSVTFAAGQSSTLYFINPKDDALAEGNETVNVSLIQPTQGDYVVDTANSNATVIILDNDSTVTLSVTDAIATERTTNEVKDPGEFRITRSGDLTSALTVNYSISGSATNGIDYSQLSGRISFVAGQSSVLIPISILDDAIAESTESLTLTITSGAGYTIGSINSGTVTIADNDIASIVVTSLNNGEILRPGGTFNITWNDNISDNVAIGLYKGGQFLTAISSSTESDGSYLWSLPTTLAYSNDYRIAVYTIDAKTFDFNNNDFSIKPDLKQYSFQYRFNPANIGVTDYYNGTVIASDGKYTITPQQSGGSYLVSDLFNFSSTATEIGSDGRYIITSVADYNDDLVSDMGRVFVTQYVDRDNGADRVFTPINYQAGQASGTNYLGSELDYIDVSRSPDSKFGQDYSEADPVLPDPGNTIVTAESQRSAIFKRDERVSSTDRDDFYRFSVIQSGIFTANLTNLSGDADVRLIRDIDNDGTIDQGEILAWQWERGTGSESIRRFLTTGNYFLQVMSYNNQTANYSVETGFQAAASDDRKFSMTVAYTSGSELLSPAMRNAVEEAARFWENVISYSSFNSTHSITITVGGVDQGWSTTGGILASAGYRDMAIDINGRWMPISGVANINNNPGAVNSLTSSVDKFRRVMIHEFGHILGFGSLWATNGRSLINYGTATYNTNTYAASAYGELLKTFSSTAIPLTAMPNQQGIIERNDGSNFSHWREEIFDREIMTHESEADVPMPLSQITIASLRDIGWNVNYGAAEPYSLT